MFNKLRNNYVFTNMLLTGSLIVLSFLAIFGLIYKNMNKEIDLELRKSYEVYLTQETNDLLINPKMFVIELDANGEATKEVNNPFKDNSLDNFLSMIKSEKGNIKYQDKDYSFKKFKMLNNQNYSEMKTVLVGKDVTTEKIQLKNMFLVMIFLLLILLGFIFLICIYLANKSVLSIKDAWDKQRQFIGDASHELKTPLSVIETNVDALSIHHQNQWTDNIKSETQRMSKLITDLLYLTKIDDYDLLFNHSDVNLSHLVTEQLLTYEVLMFEKHIILTTKIEQDIMISQDEEKLKQLIHILFDNAIKHGEDFINVRLKKEFNQIFLSVDNGGPGIKEEDFNVIFDRFYRVDESRSYNNSYGLGLSIAKAIVERMKGDIYVQSVVCERTRFTIVFKA